MKTRRLLGCIAAGGMLGAVYCAQAHADSNDAAFLDGSQLALVMGPSSFPTPDAQYLAAVDSLYLNGVPDVALTTPESSDYGASVAQGEQDLVNAVTADYAAGEFSAADPLTIMGYSQSSVVASLAEPTLAADGIPSDSLRFVLIGDTASAEGGFLNTFGDTPEGQQILTMLGDQNLIDATTPDNLYPTEVYTLQGDGWADWNNGANLLGMFTTHIEYLGVPEADIASAPLTAVDGMTDYFTIADPANMLETLITAAMNGIG